MSAQHIPELNVGYAVACFHSMSLMQSILKQNIDQYPHWYAPGCSGVNSDCMPNSGNCACGAGYWVAEFYHFFAIDDGKWHTPRNCHQVIPT